MKKKSTPGSHTPSNLQPHHMRWIIEWALAACTERITSTEGKVMCHTFFLNAHPPRNAYALEHTRQEELESAQQALTEYLDIHAYLASAKKHLSEKNAEQFADDIAAMFGRRETKTI